MNKTARQAGCRFEKKIIGDKEIEIPIMKCINLRFDSLEIKPALFNRSLKMTKHGMEIKKNQKVSQSFAKGVQAGKDMK